ncbi:MAG TPA: ABC transporter permease [Spirochaetia bacterium]|nr:ABC transporter permease [Spirochaetia bacterium]
MRLSVALLVAGRYFRTRRREAGNASSILSVAGIAVGVMTLTVVLGVMNGFQLGFIDSIVEISSYHLQCAPAASVDSSPAPDPSLPERIRALPSVTAVVPFVERQALIDGPFQRPRACVIRAVPPDLFALDPVQARMLKPREGEFDVTSRSIVIGSELAAATAVRVGGTVTLTSYAAGAGGRPVPRRDAFRVTGVFHTGYYDFDLGLVFISLPAADELYGSGASLERTYGVKIRSRFLDAGARADVEPLLRGTRYRVESWRTYNRSFFDALFMEKLMMMVLVGLIFVVVGFNVYHSLRRSVFERMEEIAVLKAVGVPPRSIQAIFVFDGLFVGVLGALSGLVIGLAVAVNVSSVFSLIEAVVNGVLRVLRALVTLFPAGGSEGFAIFSPAYFYLSSVPSHVLASEAFLVCFFAVASCAGAAWAASRAVAGFRPAEVLRHE